MSEFIAVARVGEIPVGGMHGVTVGEADVLLINIDGKIYAMSNRCGHMNAPLDEGTLSDGTVTCPFHSARFDVVTGKKAGDAIISRPPGIEKAPAEMLPFLAKAGQMTSKIQTRNCTHYQVRVEGDIVKIRFDKELEE